MTSISTIIGVLPLILGLDQVKQVVNSWNYNFWRYVVLNFFTLYVIPTVYTIFGKGTQRMDAVEIELKKQLKNNIFIFI